MGLADGMAWEKDFGTNKKDSRENLKVRFEGYTDDQKKAIQNSLMHSPICWKDGNFKFDRDTSKEPCKGKSCFTCMFETFDIATR